MPITPPMPVSVAASTRNCSRMSRARGAERLADADLARAVGDRHHHDRHHADAAHQQRHAASSAIITRKKTPVSLLKMSRIWSWRDQVEVVRVAPGRSLRMRPQRDRHRVLARRRRSRPASACTQMNSALVLSMWIARAATNSERHDRADLLARRLEDVRRRADRCRSPAPAGRRPASSCRADRCGRRACRPASCSITITGAPLAQLRVREPAPRDQLAALDLLVAVVGAEDRSSVCVRSPSYSMRC